MLDTLLCESNNYALNYCSVGDGKTISSVEVATRHSGSTCNYYSGSGESYTGSPGVYGYTDNAIWVKRGCRATFEICSGTYSGPRGS